MNYFMGQGKLSAAVRGTLGALGGYRDLGNVSALTLNLGKQPARGLVPDRLAWTGAAPNFSLTLESFLPENLALLLFGSSTTTAAHNQTANITARLEMMAPLPDINLTAVTTVKNDAETVTYVAGKDYTVALATGAIYFPANSAIPDATLVKVAYVSKPYSTLTAFTQKQSEIALRYDGVNTVDGTPVVVDIFRTKFDPVDAISLLGDNLSTLNVTGRLLPIGGLPGTNNMFQIRQV